MKPLLIFRASGDCGCGGTSYVPSASPCLPGVASANICDEKYYGLLPQISTVRLLGVPLGSNCQHFLKPSSVGLRGFVFVGADGQAYVEHEPKLTLPYFNPADEAVFPPGGGFSSIMIGTGADPVPWYFLHAPTSGSYGIVSVGGVWQVRDVGATSGVTNVCSNPGTTEKGNLVSCIDTGEVDDEDFPIYALRKLAVTHNRVIVGDIDAGINGHMTLPDVQPLYHPLADFGGLNAGSYRQMAALDPNTLETGGIKINDPSTDNTVVLCGYSATSNKFSRLAARTKEELTVDGDIAVADSGSFVSMGTHAVFAAKQFNFPDFYISATLRIANSMDNYAAIDYGLFIDGVQVHTWDVKGSKDVTLTYLHKGIAIGAHTIDIRFRQTSADGNTTIKYSNAQIFTVL